MCNLLVNVSAKTVRLTPNTHYYQAPLLIGGAGIATLCFFTHGHALIANVVLLLVAVIFIATPSYAKFALNEGSKSDGDN